MSISAGEVSVRLASREDFSEIVELLHEVGMKGQCVSTLEFYTEVDPSGFFVAELKTNTERKIIGSAFAMIFNEDLAFLNLLAVAPQYRKQGIATRLNKRGLECIGDRNLCSNMLAPGIAALRKVTTVTETFTISTYVGISSKTSFNLEQETCSPSYTLVPVDDLNFGKLVEYDSQIHTIPREKIIKVMLKEKNVVTTLCLEENSIAGYIHASQRIFMDIGPIYANNSNIAKLLLTKVLMEAPSGQEIKITIVDLNEEATNIAKSLGLKKVHSSKRIFTKRAITLPAEKCYGLMDTGFFLI